MENHMCKKPQRFLIAAVATVGFGFANLLAGTIHQEYDGPWHWDELTRQTKSLDGKSVFDTVFGLKRHMVDLETSI